MSKWISVAAFGRRRAESRIVETSIWRMAVNRILIVLAAVLAAVLVGLSPAEAYRGLNPMAVQGNWLGAPDRPPEDCKSDGYYVMFGSFDARQFTMAVQQRIGGQLIGAPVVTPYEVAPPVAGAPARIDIFFKSPQSELGVAIPTGSRIELVPAGSAKTYDKTSLYLIRCA